MTNPAFERERRAALDGTRRRLRRLEQLAAHLAHDLAGLADAGLLRREAEALLVSGRALEPGRESVEVRDPHDPGRRLTIALDPRLGGLANAERRFQKARRVERARQQVELRLRETRSLIAVEAERETQVQQARDRQDLATHAAEAGSAGQRAPVAVPRHYLTGRGLSLLVGRSARERFELDAPMRAALKRGARLAMGVEHPSYRATLVPVPAAVRDSLAGDLA